MKVYILIASVEYEQDRIVDCFSTFEKAHKRRQKIQRQRKKISARNGKNRLRIKNAMS